MIILVPGTRYISYGLVGDGEPMIASVRQQLESATWSREEEKHTGKKRKACLLLVEIQQVGNFYVVRTRTHAAVLSLHYCTILVHCNKMRMEYHLLDGTSSNTTAVKSVISQSHSSSMKKAKGHTSE